MKHFYNSSTTLQTDTSVGIEANYNRTIFGMTKTGDILYYKAPSDPAEHPMYVDSEGRNMPVDPTTLQPMYDSNGNVVDVNGNLVPKGDVNGILPHRDDIRIAVTAADFDVKDEEGNDIIVAHDGEIIPTDDDGVPGTTMVGGVPWVVGKDGQPHAPLSQVYPLRSYAPPVRAENVPVNKSGVVQTIPEDVYPEYFDISHIVKANRPSRRGVQVAWTSADEYGFPVSTASKAYNETRFYTASEDSKYKYWTSPNVSEASGTFSGTTAATFDSSWRLSGGANKASGTNMVSADFTRVSMSSMDNYVEKIIPLDMNSSYNMSFSVLAQSAVTLTVQALQWTDDQGASPNYNSGSLLPNKGLMTRVVPGGVQTDIDVDLTPDRSARTVAVRLIIRRATSTSTPKVTFTNLSVRKVGYAIAGVGPRAVYDRPVLANKIVIGVDYSVDEKAGPYTSYANMPSDTEVRVYADRGDGLFTWQRVATDPEIDDDGKITLYFNGESWGDQRNDMAATRIMGVQYVVHAMKTRGSRVNIMEISARRTYDVSEFFMNYSIDSEVSDDSFVLPFGTVNSNNGKMTLSNHDGRFNPDNRYLLNSEKDAGGSVFTDVENPFYQMLNESVQVTIDTATFLPGQTDREYVRMATGMTEAGISPGAEMQVDIQFYDDAKTLGKIFPNQAFYSGESMSVIQVLYMLLDCIGFTSVRFSDEDEHFASHLKYFWVKGDDKSVWEIIQDVCRASQTVAFFDEYNVLNFKSLKGIYESALANPPAQVFTKEDLPDVHANIISSSIDDNVTVNRVSVNYRETSEREKTPSEVAPMEAVWEPEGTEVLRGQYLITDLNAKKVGQSGATLFLSFPSGTTKTWPFSGMVQVEGELIRYEGKQYKYFRPDGTWTTTTVKTEDERKEVDKKSGDLFEKNTYTGRLKITERGAEDTEVVEHKRSQLTDFIRRYRVGQGTPRNNFNTGISVKNSRLYINAVPNPKSASRTTVTTGSTLDYRPHHIGTQLNITRNGHAGICFLLNNPGDDGVYVEVSTTNAIESMGRPRGELHIFVVKNGLVRNYGQGVDVPISRNKDYTLDVTVRDGVRIDFVRDYSAYEEIVLRYGAKGGAVRVLQGALNLHGERLATDGIYGTATRSAVYRFQRRHGLTVDGIVNKPEWRALSKGKYDTNVLAITATVDGTYTEHVQIEKSDLPTNVEAGRFGVFTRSSTDASFEYLYGIRGAEEIDYDDTGFFDFVSGGYVSDQLDAAWIYNTKLRRVTVSGKKQTRRVVNKQLKMIDFGPYAHEVRDYDVTFDRDDPAMSSFLYLSNEANVHVLDYKHQPYGATFRLANKARHDAVLNGTDAITFGSENEVDQKMMIYGSTLDINDKRVVTVSNNTSINSRGVEELTVDMNWMQTREAAEKLASHVVEAMSDGTMSHSMDVFGHAGMRVGQVVSIYDPQRGVGNASSPQANRFFVTGVTQDNDGTHSTSLRTREVIGSSGMKQIRLRDVLASNNNAMNMNPELEEYEKVGGVYLPKGYMFREGVTARYTIPVVPTAHGGGAVLLRGTGSTPYQSSMFATPFPTGVGRLPHVYGSYYILVADVTANSKVGAGVVIEGWPTTGSMTKVIASKSISMNKGDNKKIVLKGRFLADSSIPELVVGVRVLNPSKMSEGATSAQSITVNSVYFRSSQNEDDIYPLHGGSGLRKL